MISKDVLNIFRLTTTGRLMSGDRLSSVDLLKILTAGGLAAFLAACSTRTENPSKTPLLDIDRNNVNSLGVDSAPEKANLDLVSKYCQEHIPGYVQGSERVLQAGAGESLFAYGICDTATSTIVANYRAANGQYVEIGKPLFMGTDKDPINGKERISIGYYKDDAKTVSVPVFYRDGNGISWAFTQDGKQVEIGGSGADSQDFVTKFLAEDPNLTVAYAQEPTQTDIPTAIATDTEVATATPLVETPKPGEVGYVEYVADYYGMGSAEVKTVDVSDDKTTDLTADLIARSDLKACTLSISSQSASFGRYDVGLLEHAFLAQKSLQSVDLNGDGTIDGYQSTLKLLCKNKAGGVNTINVTIRGGVANGGDGSEKPLDSAYASDIFVVGQELRWSSLFFTEPGSKVNKDAWIKAAAGDPNFTFALRGWGDQQIDRSKVQSEFNNGTLSIDSAEIMFGSTGQ